jgi:hypothetical protein
MPTAECGKWYDGTAGIQKAMALELDGRVDI